MKRARHGREGAASVGTLVFLTVAVGMAAACIGLGFWQLSRRRDRLAFNATVENRRLDRPVAVERLRADPANARFRRVIVAGRYDYEKEFVLGSRTHNGSPGVYVVTPVRIATSDTAVLVVRGWVYSANGAGFDPARWREAELVQATGFIELFGPSERAVGAVTAVRPGGGPPVYRWLDASAVRRHTGYPVRPFAVVLLGDSTVAPRADAVARLAPVALGEGSHLSYAVQWFSFALISLGGAALFLKSEKKRAGRTAAKPALMR